MENISDDKFSFKITERYSRFCYFFIFIVCQLNVSLMLFKSQFIVLQNLKLACKVTYCHRTCQLTDVYSQARSSKVFERVNLLTRVYVEYLGRFVILAACRCDHLHSRNKLHRGYWPIKRIFVFRVSPRDLLNWTCRLSQIPDLDSFTCFTATQHHCFAILIHIDAISTNLHTANLIYGKLLLGTPKLYSLIPASRIKIDLTFRIKPDCMYSLAVTVVVFKIENLIRCIRLVFVPNLNYRQHTSQACFITASTDIH